MASLYKNCGCCRRACPKDGHLCPACQAAGCVKAGYGAFTRGKECPVKKRARNGQAAAASARRRSG